MNISDRKMKNPVLSNRDWHHLYIINYSLLFTFYYDAGKS